MKLYANLKAPEIPEPPQKGFCRYDSEAMPTPIPTVEGGVQAPIEARRRQIQDKEGDRATTVAQYPTDKGESPNLEMV